MEALMNAITKSCNVSSENENHKEGEDQEHFSFGNRKAQFKCLGRTVDAAREERRAKLLEEYKKKRHALVNEKRGLLFNDFDENEELMDWQVGPNKKIANASVVRSYCKNQLMLSEWLLDYPSDLDTNWNCVFCPEGRRTLVIAKRGFTRAYHKSGHLLAKFHSILPNGNKSNVLRYSDSIILDCIWREKTKELYALDVLYWTNQPLLNCDADFRLYWLKGRLMELKNTWYSKKQDPSVYDVYIPHQCTLDELEYSLATYKSYEVDGILFYHKKVPYISGQTPLVGWLKPFMLPERLGISVPKNYLMLKPLTYVNLEQWVELLGHKHLRKRKNKSKENVDKASSSKASSSKASSSKASSSKASSSKASSSTQASVFEMELENVPTTNNDLVAK